MDEMWPISETHMFSDRTINQLNLGFNRIFNHIKSFGDSTCTAATLGIQGADLGSKCSSITGYPTSLNQSTQDCIGCGLSSHPDVGIFFSGRPRLCSLPGRHQRLLLNRTPWT